MINRLIIPVEQITHCIAIILITVLSR